MTAILYLQFADITSNFFLPNLISLVRGADFNLGRITTITYGSCGKLR